MLILLLKTDNPEAEIGLYEDLNRLKYMKWHAHFELAETLHKQVAEMIKGTGKGWHDLSGIVVYKGPGSFTGLRIGITFANTLAYSLDIPIIGSTGEGWVRSGINKILKNDNHKSVSPLYGADVHITMPKN